MSEGIDVAEGGGEGQATGANTGTPDIFISYASPDSAVANCIVENLEQHGARCWMAPRDVKPGTVYADAIVGAINESKVLVLVLSVNAMASAHVGREVERAASKRKHVVAFRIDTTPLSRELEYFLSNSQWIDMPALGMSAALKKLVEAVGSAATNAADLVIPTKATTHRVGGRAKRMLGALAVVVGMGIALAVALHFWPSKHGDAQVHPVAAISDKSIAVLPFTDLSEKKDQEYFADAIAEEVLDRLAKVPGLKVVGRTSSFQFNGKSGDPASIGAALGVAYLLEGSVRKEAGRVRVTAQLVDARTGSQRWSDRFESDVIDVLNVQDTMAAEIARALQIAVEIDTVHRASAKSPEALDAYLRGLHSYDRATREGSEAAVADFQKALALDPTFAPAAIGLANAYIYLGADAWLPTKVAFERAREAAILAQRLDPKSPAPHVSMATIHTWYDWDWSSADRELQQAFALGPRETTGVQVASQLAAARGQWDEARQLAIEAVELDPLNPNAHILLGWNIDLHTGQLAQAEQSLRRALQIAPEWAAGRYMLGEALMLQGHHDAALAEFRKETLDDGQLEGSAMVHFAAARKAESDAALTEAIRHNGTSWQSEIARVYAFRGEKDRAFEWLDKAYEARDEDLYAIKDDPLFKNLEGDPRYKAFLKKMNLPE
jgi:TolB-like protein/Flp pilus assembly protein TadD